MKIRLMAMMLLLLAGSAAYGADYLRKTATDYAFPVILVDETDGYSPETEKKAADTTITYANITDGNTPSTYTDDDTLWKEIGEGTGEYRLIIGAGEFGTADKDYLVKVVVSGCRTVRFVVHTTVGSIGNVATTDDGGTINVASGRVEADVAAISGDSTAADNAELMFDGTGYAGGTTKLGVDVVSLSGDATAADNAELMFDGTGYAGGATRLKVDVSQINSTALPVSAASVFNDLMTNTEIEARTLPSGSYLTGATVVDGTVTLDDVWECLLAFMTGRVAVTDNGDTRTFQFYMRDGTTVQYSITSSEIDGSRTTGGTIN